jgi:hypothetical protein
VPRPGDEPERWRLGHRARPRLCESSKFTQHWVRDFSINASFLQTINRPSGLAMTVRGGSTDFATIDQDFPSGLAHQKGSVFGV